MLYFLRLYNSRDFAALRWFGSTPLVLTCTMMCVCVGLLGGRESSYYIYLYSSQRKEFFFLSSSFFLYQKRFDRSYGIYTFSVDIVRKHDVKETRSGAFACVPATRVARTELNNTTQHTQKVEYKLNGYYCICIRRIETRSQRQNVSELRKKNMGRSGGSSV
jgi:hypothetical protein